MTLFRAFILPTLTLLLVACGQDGIIVDPDLNPPIADFEAIPDVITAGESATLTWEVSGDVTAVSIAPGIGPVSGAAVVVSPTMTTTYILTAVTADEEYTAATTVTVQ